MPNVLVVDDDERAVRGFVDMIEAEVGLDVVSAVNPRDALEIAKQSEIQVAVLDQRMPLMSGTQLAGELWRLIPDMRIVLFSGQMEGSDFEEALQSGKLSFLRKENVDELPQLVYRLYLSYRASLTSQAYDNPAVIEEYRSGFSFRGSKVTVSLLGIEDVLGASEIWLEERFQPIVTLQAGQEQEFVRTGSQETQVLFENERQRKATTEAKVSAKATFELPIKPEIAFEAKNTIERTIRERVQASRTLRQEESIRVTYSLPNDVTTDDGVRVSAREIQESPIYERKRSRIKVSCECCGMESVESVALLAFTGRWKMRQIEFLSDGSRRIVYTS